MTCVLEMDFLTTRSVNQDLALAMLMSVGDGLEKMWNSVNSSDGGPMSRSAIAQSNEKLEGMGVRARCKHSPMAMHPPHDQSPEASAYSSPGYMWLNREQWFSMQFQVDFSGGELDFSGSEVTFHGTE